METPFVFRIESFTPQSKLAPEPDNGFGDFDRRLIVIHFNSMIKKLLHDMLYCSEHLPRLKPKPENLERIETNLHVIGLNNIEKMEPVKGFSHIKRYRWKAPGTINYPRFANLGTSDFEFNGVQDNYSGFVLLANYGYHKPSDFTFLIIAENMGYPFVSCASNDISRIIGQNVLSSWLSGGFTHHPRIQRRWMQNRFEYLNAIHHWLRFRTLKSVLKPTQFIEPVEHIAQWENLLQFGDLTETQTALKPELQDTEDHAKWLIFADSIEEITHNDPNLEIIRFFHTEPHPIKVKSNLDLFVGELYYKKK